MIPLLTIAVPTYNRVDCLRLLVSRLLDELGHVTDSSSLIELIVVNNASSDGTAEYLNDLGAGGRVKVFHNASNLGMDGNFVRCFEVASGRWLWLCSDDDLPMLGAVKLIVEALRGSADQCAMIYLPARFQAGSLEDNRDKAEAAFRTESARQFAARVNGLFTFITCIIADRSAFLARTSRPNFAPLHGSLFVFFEWELELLKRSNRFGYFTHAITVARAENSRGYDFARVFTKRFSDACTTKLGDRADLRRLLVDGMRYRHLPTLFYSTRIGRNGNLDFDASGACREYVEAYGGGPYYYLVMFPVMALPRPLARAALLIGRIWGKLWKEWSAVNTARSAGDLS